MNKMPRNLEHDKAPESSETTKKVDSKVDAGSPSAAIESGSLREAISGLNEGEETGAEAMGNVSEGESTGKERGSSGSIKTSAKDDEDALELRRQKLIASKPSKREMLSDIKRHFREETKELRKELKAAENKGDWQTFNTSYSKLRNITDFISNLAHATYDALKNAWLKVKMQGNK